MPRYYFHLSNKRCVTDPYGTVLLDKDAAMTHALVVARELMFNSSGMLGQRWSGWTMLVKDKDGKNVLTLPFSEVPEGLTRHYGRAMRISFRREKVDFVTLETFPILFHSGVCPAHATARCGRTPTPKSRVFLSH